MAEFPRLRFAFLCSGICPELYPTVTIRAVSVWGSPGGKISSGSLTQRPSQHHTESWARMANLRTEFTFQHLVFLGTRPIKYATGIELTNIFILFATETRHEQRTGEQAHKQDWLVGLGRCWATCFCPGAFDLHLLGPAFPALAFNFRSVDSFKAVTSLR